MSGVELKAGDAQAAAPVRAWPRSLSLRVLPVLATVVAVAIAAALGYQAWQYYMGAPWTRDGAVRAYVVKIAPQVAGQIVQLPVADNQFVRKGDLLMVIDPRNYSIAVRQAGATAEQTRATAENANAEMARRLKLSDDAVTEEERQTYVSRAATAEATYQSALADLDQARVNFNRTEVRSPVNGYITNLSAQLGDYANVGALQLSVVNSDSYWVDAYFEETALGRIREGDAATVKLMGFSPLLRGRVQGLSRGINVPNATPDASGLASVNPIFTFVRLAQRVPVRIHIDEVPAGVELIAGLTATVQIEPDRTAPAPGSKPSSPLVSEARPEPDSLDRLAAAPRAAPLQAPVAATPPGQAASPPAARGAQSRAAAEAVSSETRQSDASQSPAPASAAAQPLQSAPPSAAAAAAAAAAADLKTLEQQIAANPPAGDASSSPAASGGSAAATASMAPSEYLGRTIDLFGDQSVSPQPRPRTPESIRRRARSAWRHSGQRSPAIKAAE